MVASFLQRLRHSLGEEEDDVYAGILDLTQEVCNIPFELRETIRISCLCTARALSCNLGPAHPVVLNTWANYYRHWDACGLDRVQFMDSYRKAFKGIEGYYRSSHDYTINVLCDYVDAAVYICKTLIWPKKPNLKKTGQYSLKEN